MIATPATTNGTILAGVTRRSIIEIASDHGCQVTVCEIAYNPLVLTRGLDLDAVL